MVLSPAGAEEAAMRVVVEVAVTTRAEAGERRRVAGQRLEARHPGVMRGAAVMWVAATTGAGECRRVSVA